MTPQEILTRVAKLEAERDNWRDYWQDLAHFCLPQKAYINRERIPGEKLDFHRIFDSTAILALQDMAAGFNSHLTNPSSPWFALGTKNKRLMDDKQVRVWFNDVNEELRSTLNTSNFNSITQEFYQDTGCFGTGNILTEADVDTRVRFTMIPIEEWVGEEDSRGIVNRLFRTFKYTAQQAFDRWGSKAGEVVAKSMSDKKFDRKIDFVHAVFPRDKRQEGKIDQLNMPFASQWFEKSKQQLISEGGFIEFPYAVGRWTKRTGEFYGFSPAKVALADIKMLNAEQKTLIRGAMKMVDPPSLVPNQGLLLPLNMNPAGVNYANPQIINDAWRPMNTNGNIPIGIEMIERVKSDIKETFYVQLFKAFSQITKQMTIPEVQRRIAENSALLGPVVDRFTQEVFDPIITRTFFILLRGGFLPEPPQQLQGQELDIDYISQLALARRQVELNSIERTINDVGSIAQLIPSALDKIDSDKVVDKIARINGLDPELMRGEKEVEQIRVSRAKAEQAQAQLATLQQGADIAKTGAEAAAKV